MEIEVVLLILTVLFTAGAFLLKLLDFIRQLVKDFIDKS